MKYLIILLLIVCCQQSFGQHIDWRGSKDWKTYRVRGHGLFSYSLDTLRHFKSYPLNADSMGNFLKDVVVVPDDSTPVWMGAYVATCSIGGKVIKVEISTYGGFFYCEADRQIYQVANTLKNEWQDYIVSCYHVLYP